MLFNGNCTAVVTPFTKDLKKINFKTFGKLIDKQIESGCEAILLLGTTGETPTLSMQEKINIVNFGVEYIDKRVPLIVGAGSNNTKEAIEKSEIYSKCNVDALLHVTPYYNKATQNGLYEHFKAISKSVDLPIIIYNVPSRTGVNILPQTVEKLSQFKNIVGIKEASGNVEQACEIKRICHKNFAVYCGEDALVLPLLSIGAQGCISVTGNLYPKEMNDICKFFFNNNIEKSREMQYKLMPLIKMLFIEVNPIPIKHALEFLGYDIGGVRLPLTKMSDENAIKLDELLKNTSF